MYTDSIRIVTKTDYEDFLKFISDPDVKVIKESKENTGIVYEFNTYDTIYVPNRFISKDKPKGYKTILSSSDRDYLERLIDSWDIIAFDIETTGLNTRLDKVIGFSVSGKEGVGLYYPIQTWKNNKLCIIEDNNDKIEYFLNKLIGKKLITWNGSFDLRFILNKYNIDLIDSLYIEGMLLKHTIEEEGVFGLKKVAINIQNHIGFDVEDSANKEQIALKANVEKNGGSTTKINYEMYKADLEIMAPYAAADADLTLRVSNFYLKRLKEEGLEDFFFKDEVMPLYKEVTIPMERKGVKLDMELLTSSKRDIDTDIDLLEKRVIEDLFTINEAKEWYNNSVESVVKESTRGRYGQEVSKYFELDLPKTANGKYSLSKTNIAKLPDSVAKSFLLGEIDTLGSDIKHIIKESIYLSENDNKYINLKSKKQLSEVIFNYLHERPLGKTPKGSPQFNEDMVSSLKDKYDFAKQLHNYNKLNKIKSSYIDRFLDRQEDGRYYFSYKQHGTISGRYGSDAQQLPRPMETGQEDDIVLKYNNRIRAFFISEKDRIFIDSDFNSLEPSVFAHVSGDERLRDIFRKGHDFYSTIAIDTEELYEYSPDKKAENYLGKLDKQKRQDSKEYALGVPYGMTGYALAKTLDISIAKGEELVKNYLSSYPSLNKWMDLSKRQAQTKGFVVSELGRIRHLPKVKKLHKIYGEKLLDYKYRNFLKKRMDKKEIFMMYMDYKNGVNNSRNFQIQSMSASIVNRAAIAINREFIKLEINAWCCAQVHDQLIFNIPDKDYKKCSEIVERLMSSTTKLSVELKAPAKSSKNWRDGH